MACREPEDITPQEQNPDRRRKRIPGGVRSCEEWCLLENIIIVIIIVITTSSSRYETIHVTPCKPQCLCIEPKLQVCGHHGDGLKVPPASWIGQACTHSLGFRVSGLALGD